MHYLYILSRKIPALNNISKCSYSCQGELQLNHLTFILLIRGDNIFVLEFLELYNKTSFKQITREHDKYTQITN